MGHHVSKGTIREGGIQRPGSQVGTNHLGAEVRQFHHPQHHDGRDALDPEEGLSARVTIRAHQLEVHVPTYCRSRNPRDENDLSEGRSSVFQSVTHTPKTTLT